MIIPKSCYIFKPCAADKKERVKTACRKELYENSKAVITCGQLDFSLIVTMVSSCMGNAIAVAVTANAETNAQIILLNFIVITTINDILRDISRSVNLNQDLYSPWLKTDIKTYASKT